MVKHAKLAPSGAERWVNCPGSLMFNDLPGKDTVYSKEGTLAHEAAEKALYNAPLNYNRLQHKKELVELIILVPVKIVF